MSGILEGKRVLITGVLMESSIAFHTAKVKTAKDLFERELIIGNTGPGTGTYTYPKALNGLVGRFTLAAA